MAEVERGTKDLESGKIDKTSLEAQVLPNKLDMAEKLLKEAKEGMPKCDEGLTKLRLGR
jgi:hypothetical protein